jgi:hypothetical protein
MCMKAGGCVCMKAGGQQRTKGLVRVPRNQVRVILDVPGAIARYHTKAVGGQDCCLP